MRYCMKMMPPLGGMSGDALCRLSSIFLQGRRDSSAMHGQGCTSKLYTSAVCNVEVIFPITC